MATLLNPNVAYRRMPARPQARQDNRFVYLAVALGYVMLLPQQLSLNAFGSVIPPYRFFLIPAFLFIVGSGLRGRWRMILPDYLMVICVGWIWLALYNTTRSDDWITAAIAQTVDIGLAYFFARAAFKTLRDLRMFLLLMVPGLAIMAGFVALEAILHRHILQPFVGSLVGVGGYYPIDERMGLMRSRGPFPHPILAGIFFASFLPLFWMSGLRGWPRKIGIAASLFAGFSVSSAAMLALSVSSILMIYNWLSERIVNLSWRMFFVGLSILVFVLELATDSGSFNLIMRYASFNSLSSYNRVLIWRYGTENVAKHPWFGVGYGYWERPLWMGSSIDHYWLINAIQFGIIPPLMMALTTILAVLAVFRRVKLANPVDKTAYIGLAIAVSVFALGAVSVSLWLSVQVWFHMLIGLCVSLGYADRLGSEAPPRPVRRLVRPAIPFAPDRSMR